MNSELSPKANPHDVFQSVWHRLLWLFFTLYLTVLWFVLGPSNPGYAVSVVAGTFALGPTVATSRVMRRVPRQWFRVPAGERVLHRVVGVRGFRRLLERTGWERYVHRRQFRSTKAGLLDLEWTPHPPSSQSPR